MTQLVSPRKRPRRLLERIHTQMALWRQALDLSPGEVARAVGVSKPTVSRWESGVHYPELEHLERFCLLVGTDLAGFWGAVPKRKRAA